MATSGTHTFDPDIAEIFDEAFERAGIAPLAIGAAHIRSALRSLKFMLNSEWSTIGVRQWQIQQATQQMTSVGQTSFTLPAGGLDIMGAVLRRGGVDIEMTALSRNDYLVIPDKNVRGRPDRYFVDRQASTRTVYFWQAAENTTDVIVYDYFRQMEDAGRMSNTLQMPPHALDACAAGLAYRLAGKYNRDLIGQLAVEYGGREYPNRISGGALERMREEDRERGDLHVYAAFEPRTARR